MSARISERILNLVLTGSSLKNAVDQVLGAGTYDRIASEVYDSLRTQWMKRS